MDYGQKKRIAPKPVYPLYCIALAGEMLKAFVLKQ
jgi:hypothetical protein